MTFYAIIRAILLGDGSLLNDANWVEHALKALAAHEAKYPAPVQAAPVVQDAAPADPDPRDAEIAALQAQVAELTAAGSEGSPG